MELEDGVVYQDDPGTSAMMSERVCGLAGSIYRELERLIARHGEHAVKELMPLVVAALESLDAALAESQEQEVELELLREDNEQLLTQHEREKALRRQAEERFMEFEDAQQQEVKEQQGRMETLQSHARHLELRTKNYAEQISRFEERESELKKDFNSLHQRHTEGGEGGRGGVWGGTLAMIHTYMELLERTKLLGDASETGALGRVRKERPLSLGIFPPSTGGAVHTPEPQRKAETPTTDLSQSRPSTCLKRGALKSSGAQEGRPAESKDELSGSRAAPQEEEGGMSRRNIAVQATPGSRCVSTGAAGEETSEVQAIIQSTPELGMDQRGWPRSSSPAHGFENLAFDRNTESLFEELSSAGNDLIGDVDEGADLL
ncbi:hypothetical protein AAFF_G00212130, partial [Aldrovandia affinis]